jgi:hypothetical protein
MKTSSFIFKSLRPPILAVAVSILLLTCACDEEPAGPINPHEKESTFSGSVGSEEFYFTENRVSALGGLVTLQYLGSVPDEPMLVSVATFPVTGTNLDAYNTTGRCFYLNFNSISIAIAIELKYDEEDLKGTFNPIPEDGLMLYRVVTAASNTTEEDLRPVFNSRVDVQRNVVTGVIHNGGTYIIAAE